MSAARFFAVLGNTPDLSQLELEQLLAIQLQPVTPHLLALPEITVNQVVELGNNSGGTVKILQLVTELKSDDEAELLSTLVEYLTADESQSRVTFALSQLTEGSTMPISDHDLKKALKAQGVSSRYLTPQGSTQISAAAWDQNPDLQEIFLVRQADHYLLLTTVWVQNLQNWADRDRGKPYADRKKGMLPPKVARMMLNLVSTRPTETTQPTVYDPFCGSGTILMEAAMLGYNIVGSDLDADAIQGTGQNLHWLSQEVELEVSPTLFKHDVTQQLPPNIPQADTIVTEPFLGKPRPSPKQVPNIIKGLEKMYLGAFKRWTDILKPGGEVVIIFPAIQVDQHTHTLESLIDKLDQFGYSISLGPVEYSRPQATVKRHMYRFTYQPK